MRTSRLLLIALALLVTGGTSQAQILRQIGNAAGNAARNAATRNAERRSEQTVDKIMTPETYGNQGNSNGGNDQQPTSGGGTGSASGSQTPQSAANAEMNYAKSDFVPGDVIIFEDFQEGEKLGEFPSQWDLISGNAEIASINGEKCIYLIDSNTSITPLIKPSKNYLPEEFTIEFDYLARDEAHTTGMNQYFHIYMYSANNEHDKVFESRWYPLEGRNSLYTYWQTPDGESRIANSEEMRVKGETWQHVAISFNKRAFKMYLNGNRIVNIPNMARPAWFFFYINQDGAKELFYIKNIRVAKGAVPLYDRIMSDGKIVTYGITFDVGKSTIKPESMTEINRIAQLMKDNPELRFSVEGHTDSTGNAASNQTLSDARSKAVVDKLVGMGIAADRLQAAGKGQTSPIADNSTEEGRARNRRVEFVKL